MVADNTEMSASVVIAAHNGEAFIGEALESVFEQSLLPQEIVVVDDCSTDGTRDLVRSVGRASPIPIRLLELPVNSGGPAGPLNVGTAAAVAEWVVLLDQDDRMAPNKVEIASALLARHQSAGLFFGQMQPMSNAGGLMKPLDGQYAHYPAETRCMPAREAFRDLITKGFRYGGAGGMAIRKRAWQGVGAFRGDFQVAWDYDFAVRVVLAGWDVAYAPETVYYHRVHPGNLERAQGGLRGPQEVSRMLTECIDEPSLSPAELGLVRAAAGRALVHAGYVHRVRCKYAASFDYYLLAMRKTRVVWPSLVGLLKLSLSPVRDALLLTRSSNRPEAFRESL
jgi:GT2 family glycosyltransferase